MYAIPSRSTLTRSLLSQEYERVTDAVKQMLLDVEYVTLTTDSWTSNSTEAFVAVTAHFITKAWKMESILFDCSRFTGSHTGLQIRRAVIEICEEWGVANKVHAIVTDNASNMTSAVALLGFAHLPCLAHTIFPSQHNSVGQIC